MRVFHRQQEQLSDPTKPACVWETWTSDSVENMLAERWLCFSNALLVISHACKTPEGHTAFVFLSESTSARCHVCDEACSRGPDGEDEYGWGEIDIRVTPRARDFLLQRDAR